MCKESSDEIESIRFIELHDDTNTLAFGWLGNLNYLGTISPTNGFDGIRLRCGNILIGNKDALSPLFKENRFNHYLVGELHVVDKRLIPNSRRDDFEDSVLRGRLFNEFLKEIGIPFSKKIRDLSKERGKVLGHGNTGALFKQASAIIEHGYLSVKQRDRLIDRLNHVNGSHSTQEVQRAKELSELLLSTKDILMVQKYSQKSKEAILKTLNSSLELISSEIVPTSSTNDLMSRLYGVITKKQ